MLKLWPSTCGNILLKLLYILVVISLDISMIRNQMSDVFKRNFELVMIMVIRAKYVLELLHADMLNVPQKIVLLKKYK